MGNEKLIFSKEECIYFAGKNWDYINHDEYYNRGN